MSFIVASEIVSGKKINFLSQKWLSETDHMFCFMGQLFCSSSTPYSAPLTGIMAGLKDKYDIQLIIMTSLFFLLYSKW